MLILPYTIKKKMNIEQLRYLVSSSSNPVVVEINDDLVNLEGKVYENGATCYGNFSPGMRAEIISISAEEVFENDPHASLYTVTLSMEKFFEHNCIVDRGDLYGENNRTYKWHELSCYPKDHIETIYTGGIVIEFTLLDQEELELFNEFINSDSKLNYVRWLENQIQLLRNR